MTRRSANCPAPDCGFTDVPSLVAAHVNGTEGPEHDWQRLPYDGPGAFLSAARAGEVDDGEGVHGAPDPDDAAGDQNTPESDDAAGDGDATEAGSVSGGDPAEDDETARAIDPDPLLRAVEVARDRAADVDDLGELDDAELADLFVAFSVVASRARAVRSDVRSAIIDRVDDEREIGGTLGSVDRSRSARRSLRDAETVRSALFRAGIDPREARSFDPDRVASVIEAADDGAGITEADVFETSESDHVRRASVYEPAFDERGDQRDTHTSGEQPREAGDGR